MNKEVPFKNSLVPEKESEEGKMRDMNRREFLRSAVAGVTLLAGREKIIKKLETSQETVEVKVIGNEWQAMGEGSNVSSLHNAVAQAFEGALDREIKARDYTIGYFAIRIGRRGNGKYFLEYQVRLTPTKNPRETHRIIGLFGKVWSGKEAKSGSRKLYDEGVSHWQRSMEKAYPDMRFWTEEAEAGNNEVYHVGCIMKGAKK